MVGISSTLSMLAIKIGCDFRFGVEFFSKSYFIYYFLAFFTSKLSLNEHVYISKLSRRARYDFEDIFDYSAVDKDGDIFDFFFFDDFTAYLLSILRSIFRSF